MLKAKTTPLPVFTNVNPSLWPSTAPIVYQTLSTLSFLRSMQSGSRMSGTSSPPSLAARLGRHSTASKLSKTFTMISFQPTTLRPLINKNSKRLLLDMKRSLKPGITYVKCSSKLVFFSFRFFFLSLIVLLLIVPFCCPSRPHVDAHRILYQWNNRTLANFPSHSPIYHHRDGDA